MKVLFSSEPKEPSKSGVTWPRSRQNSTWPTTSLPTLSSCSKPSLHLQLLPLPISSTSLLPPVPDTSSFQRAKPAQSKGSATK